MSLDIARIGSTRRRGAYPCGVPLAALYGPTRYTADRTFPVRRTAGSSRMSRAGRSIWKCTSRYSGIDAGTWHSTNASTSLTSRVTTDTNLSAPPASRQVRRPGTAILRRLPIRAAVVGVWRVGTTVWVTGPPANEVYGYLCNQPEGPCRICQSDSKPRL